MRSLRWLDGSYESHVTLETRALVESTHPIHTKIALIEAAIADEAKHIGVLENQLAIADERRRERLLSVIGLRRRAVAYLRMTVKSLVVQSEGSDGMHRYCAIANEPECASDGITFMEYSS